MKKTFTIILFSLLSAGLIYVLSGCYGIPKGTTEEATAGQLLLKATSAGIVKANDKKTTYKIKCSLCSFETENKTILTPTVNSPYVLDWLCPNCA
ncbi:MAG: hypothetical protein WCP55_12070, partial [Lentisphaerota bacterium]